MKQWTDPLWWFCFIFLLSPFAVWSMRPELAIREWNGNERAKKRAPRTKTKTCKPKITLTVPRFRLQQALTKLYRGVKRVHGYVYVCERMCKMVDVDIAPTSCSAKRKLWVSSVWVCVCVREEKFNCSRQHCYTISPSSPWLLCPFGREW